MAEEKNIQQVSDFTDIVDNINDLDFSDNQRYIICDYNNPKNHMEVSTSLETHKDRQYVNTEFKVFKDNQEQKCSDFPHGKFTHYSRADGTNSSQQGNEHWEKMKKDYPKTIMRLLALLLAIMACTASCSHLTEEREDNDNTATVHET